MVSCDIINLLNDRLMTDAIRNILSRLDEESLRQAELVSLEWRKVICEECIWKFILRNKVLATPVWEKFTYLNDIEWRTGPIGQDGHVYFKNMFKTIQRQLVKLERNWRTGNCTTRKLDCGLVRFTCVFTLSDKYLAAAHEDFTVKLWSRKIWVCDKVFRGHNNRVACLQLTNNLLITGSDDKTIKVWDLETTELLNTVRDSLGAVKDLKHENGYLISLSSADRRDEDSPKYTFCVTVRQTSSPQNISEGTCVSLNRYCYGIDFNEKYIVVPIEGLCEGDECDVQLYSLSSLEVVRTMKGCYHFQLLRNFVISELHDGTTRIWDTETGECKRIIDNKIIDAGFGFNEKYLVTGGNDIQVKIWDLQALVDFQNDDSHPFLLTTLPSVEGSRNGYYNFTVDDFLIAGFLNLDPDPQIVIRDFMPSTA